MSHSIRLIETDTFSSRVHLYPITFTAAASGLYAIHVCMHAGLLPARPFTRVNECAMAWWVIVSR